MITKENYLYISLILFGLSLIFFVLTYICFHYVGENGLAGKEFHKECRKPFVSNLFGIFSTMLLTSSIIFLLLGLFAN